MKSYGASPTFQKMEKAANEFRAKSKVASMSVNHIMILLDIYRGTFSPARHMGTILGDVIELRKNGFIRLVSGEFELTPKGNERVQRCIG